VLTPLALAIGQGSSIQQSLVIAVIAGLPMLRPRVLLAMPVLIGLTVRRAARRSATRDEVSAWLRPT
jgi:multidrug efflux pump subunit AcrB